MILNKASLREAFKGLKTTFQNSVEAAEPDEIEQLTVTVPTSSSGADFPVGQLVGDLEEVLDEVAFDNIGVWMQRIDAKTFAKGVSVKINDIADDNLGIYRPVVEQYARRAAVLPLRLMVEAFVNAYTEEWIDGNPVFYASAREWPGGSEETFTNRHDLQLNEGNFNTLYQEMEERTGPDGNPLGLSPDWLICGPSNRAAAENLLQVQRSSDGSTNRLYQRANLMVDSRISSDAWALVDTNPVKPIALLDRSGPNFYSQTDLTSENAMHQEQLEFKARRRCNVQIMAPWLFQASDGNA